MNTDNAASPDYLDWLAPLVERDGAADTDPEPTGHAAAQDNTPNVGTVVRFPGSPRSATPIVVAGVCGGAGATVVAALLAEHGATSGAATAAVDGTATGGDLAERASMRSPAGFWQQWLDEGSDGAGLDDVAGRSSQGAFVLPRYRRLPDYRSPLAAAVSRLAAGGVVPVTDLGASVGSAWSDAVLALAPRLVLTVPDRADGANRARPVLSTLLDHIGAAALAATVVVVTGQHPTPVASVLPALQQGLTGRVAAVIGLPYDPHLARGTGILYDLLTDASRDRIAQLADVLAETEAKS